MKKYVFFGVVLILLGVFGAWLWRLGVAPTLAASTARLEEVEGRVEVRAGMNGTWQTAQDGQSIQQGTHIRTGETGTVVLTVSGVSQTRLSTSTELIVDALLLPQENELKTNTSLVLLTGRTWSRIVRLLEVDSAYTITTDDVVATVRGTAFEMRRSFAKETTLVVYEGSVKAADKILAKGTGLRAKGRVVYTATSTADLGIDNAWTEQNIKADKDFLKQTQKEWREELTQGISPRAYEIFGRAGEKMHVLIATEEEKDHLRERYLGRRLAYAKWLQEEGRLDHAEEELADVKKELEAKRKGEGHADQSVLKEVLIHASVLYQDLPDYRPAEFLKERIEDVKMGEFVPLPPPDVKSDDQVPFFPPSKIEPAPVLSPKEPLPSSPELKQDVPTSFIPPPPAPAPSPTDPKLAQDPRFSVIMPRTLLVPGSLVVHVKGRAPLSAFAEYTNGTKRDVSDQTTFISSDPSLATVSGNIVQAMGRLGTVRVTATYRENGVTVTTSLSVSIQL